MLEVRERRIKSFWSTSTTFFISIFVTVAFWTMLPVGMSENESSDFVTLYEPVGRNIAEGRGITFEGNPAIRTPPGYPLLLAVLITLSEFFKVSESVALSIFILLCAGIASICLFWAARRVWGEFPAFVSSMFWITNPFVLWLTKQPNSELPFLVAFYGGFNSFCYALLTNIRPFGFFFLSGICMGIAMLIRPIAIGLGVVLSLVIWFIKRDAPMRLRCLFIGMVLLGNLVAVAPWEVWVYYKTGSLVMLSTGGGSAIRDGLTFGVNLRGFRSPQRMPDDVLELMEEISANHEQTETLAELVMFLVGKLPTHAAAMAKLFGLKIMRSWYGTDSGRFELAIMLVQIPYLVLLLWATFHALKCNSAARVLAVTVWTMVFYFWAMTLLAVSMLRYMVPAYGLLFVLVPACFTRTGSHEIMVGDRKSGVTI